MKNMICRPWWGLMLTALLVSVPFPAKAYWPPLTAVEAVIQGDEAVRCGVFDPQLNHGVYGYQKVNNPRNLQIQDGIVTWVSNLYPLPLDDPRCTVWFSVYDPGRKAWKTASFYWIWTVDQVTVSDGVVMATGKYNQYYPDQWYVIWATYDPAIGDWIMEGEMYYGPAPVNLQNNCGIVAFADERPPYLHVFFVTYDPKIHQWVYGGFFILDGTLSDLVALGVAQGTVFIAFTGENQWYRYRWEHGHWEKDPTDEYPLAHFVAQQRGSWVWFTDMSLGAKSWLWTIQSSSTYRVSDRSLYREFAGGELLTVNQLVGGYFGATHDTSQQIKVSLPLPHLLLLLE